MGNEKIQRVFDYTGNPSEDLFGSLAIYKRLIHTPGKNIHKTLSDWRLAYDKLYKYLLFQSEVNRSLKMELDLYKECKDTDLANAGKNWSSMEDEYIVESRAAGDRVEKIATALMRSPFSVATRLSLLIGQSRSLNVRRAISGNLDGEEVEGIFEGRMRKA